MFRVATFVSLLALSVFLFATDSSAQKTSGRAVTKPAEMSKLSRSSNRQVTVELERQQAFLHGVTTRFEAVANHDFVPLLKYSYVWTALYENRISIAKDVRGMDPDQSKLLTKGYDELEREAVASFGDHQLSILNDVLELNEFQFDSIQRAVEDDLNSRRDLLKTKDLTEREFVTRLNAISANTESKLVSVLFPEQKKNFQKQMNFTRDRLVG